MGSRDVVAGRMVILKLHLTTLEPSIGNQLLDAWHAYRQHINQYNSGIEYVFDQGPVRSNDSVSILFDYMGERVTDLMVQDYDIVLICNGSEPLAVASPRIRELLTQHNVWLVANSYLIDHELQSKVIWFCADLMNCRDYWTRHFYPQFFDMAELIRLPRRPTTAFIFGSNRAHRQFFCDSLKSVLPRSVLHTQFAANICECQQSQWETVEDLEFRNYVNDIYNAKHITNEQYQTNYYASSIPVGIDDKFGTIPPGYFPLPLYYENSCVVFPETSWQNNELTLTEKSFKCFASGSLPFPVGGAKLNYLFNQLGFFTAWNLLPEQYQDFDNMVDHANRIAHMVQSLKWLHDHPEVFCSDQFVEYARSNQLNFLSCRLETRSVKSLDHIIQTQFAAKKQHVIDKDHND